jgi:hypothetical protein
MDELVRPVEMTGQAVNALVMELLPTVSGQPVALFSAAALTLILCSLRPEIDDVELVEGLKDISGYITVWISGYDDRVGAKAGEPVARMN